MYTQSGDNKEEIISYQQLRTFIGIIGLFLPFVLVIGCLAFGDGISSFQPSISHYYYSTMHIVFVTALCVLGGFLITYKGKPGNPWESRFSNIAGYLALGVAALPTQLAGFRYAPNSENQYLQLCKEISKGWGNIHFAVAGLLFVCFIIFCWVFFQWPDKIYRTPLEIKKFERRKNLYWICGWGILISIVAIGLFAFFLPNRGGLLAYTTFFFETTSLWFFGIAWLVKGSLAWCNYPVLKWLIKRYR